MLGFARELRQRVATFEADLRGEATDTPVTLAAGRGSYLYLLGPGLRRFQRGQWSLRAQVAGRDAYLEAVRLGRAHVAVTAAVAPKPEDLIVRSLRTVSSMLAFPADQAWSPRWRWRPTVGIAHRRPVGLVTCCEMYHAVAKRSGGCSLAASMPACRGENGRTWFVLRKPNPLEVRSVLHD